MEIFQNLPNHLIIKILVERKNIKTNDRYHTQYNKVMMQLKESSDYIRQNTKLSLIQCLTPAYDYDSDDEEIEYDDGSIDKNQMNYFYNNIILSIA